MPLTYSRNYDPLWGSFLRKERTGCASLSCAIISQMSCHYPTVKVTADQGSVLMYLNGRITNQWLNLLNRSSGFKTFHQSTRLKICPSLDFSRSEIMQEIYQEGWPKISSRQMVYLWAPMAANSNQTLGGAVFEVLPSKPKWKTDINLQVEIRGRSLISLMKPLRSRWSGWNFWKEHAHAIWWDWFSSSGLALKRGVDIGRSLLLTSLYQSWCAEKSHDLTRTVTKFGAISVYQKYLLLRFRRLKPRHKAYLMTWPSLYDAHYRPYPSNPWRLVIINGGKVLVGG